VLGQFTAVNIRFLLAIFKEGAGNVFPQFADIATSNKHVFCCTPEFCLILLIK
jgi:hypothetical protein